MMERGSDKHGSRLDEQLEHEVSGLIHGTGPTHAEEWKDPEPSGEDQPMVGRAEHLEVGTPPGMTEDQIELRSALAARLGRAAFPADAAALRAHLTADHAPGATVELLAGLPDGEEYATLGELWTALGYPHEAHRF